MNRHAPFDARMRGFGLVEIMIAMTLGLLLLAGLYDIFLSNKMTYNTQQALARLQENARYVVHTLSYDLRMAGYTGCRRRSPKSMQINIIASGLPADGFTTDGFVAIHGEKDGNGDDTVTLRGASAKEARLADDKHPPKDQITLVSNPDNIGDGDLAYISDCSNADLFWVADVVGKPGEHDDHEDDDDEHRKKPPPKAGDVTLRYKNNDNNNKDLSKPYGPQARVSAFRTRRYYLQASDSATLPDGKPAPALWRDIDGKPSELVQGVQAMQIEYGVNTNDDALRSADAYKPAKDVADWDEVVSVRVALLMQSLTLATDTADTTSTYTLLDKTVGPFNDRYLRRVVTFSVALRNRVH